MKTKLIQAAIVSVILITGGNAGTQIYADSSAILQKGSQKKTEYLNGYATASRKFANTSDALEKLINAIGFVESGGRSDILGDNGHAAGMFQLHEVAVRHVNEKFHTNYVWPQDTLNPVMARQIAKFYLIICGYGKKPLEETIRRWNGGEKHWQSVGAGQYWLKVERAIERTAR